MADCGTNNVLKENKIYKENELGRGRVEEEMPHVGGSRHIPKGQRAKYTEPANSRVFRPR